MQSDRQSLLIYPVRVFDRPRTDRIANQAGACSVALLVQVHERWPERPPETDAVPHSAETPRESFLFCIRKTRMRGLKTGPANPMATCTPQLGSISPLLRRHD